MGPPVKCPFKTQGNFHTHADVSNVKRGSPVSDKVARKFVLELAKREGISICINCFTE